MKKIGLVLAFAVCLAGCTAKEFEKVTVINGAVPVFKFTLPKGDAFGNYTKFSAQFLVDAENYRKFARLRAYGQYPAEYFSDIGDMVFLDFEGDNTDKNGPYLLSNVIGTNSDMDSVSGGAGADEWFTLEFPLFDMAHWSYNPEHFPDSNANGDMYFALGLGTADRFVSLTYYIREVTLQNDDGSKRIVSKGSGFKKPAFIGYYDGITELRRSSVKRVDSVEADSSAGYYRVKEIYPWLYSLYDPNDVYCYLAIGNEKALLFDTAYGIGSLPDAIREITDKPVTVVLGHGHLDHANGAYQFDEAWLHEDDFDLCYAHTSPDFRHYIMDGRSASSLPEGFNLDAYINAGAGNLRKLEPGQVFDLGGLHIEVIDMEGHTAGSIGLLVQEHRVLLDSDSANPYVYMQLEESLPVSRYIAMLERTIKLDFDTFFTGHSEVAMTKSDFQKFINVARNASPEKAEYLGDGVFRYHEGGMNIFFTEENLK
jgi:glyoxylase-like metal-dependent hydrolase (beta-lactamase superfamily II)